MMTLAKVTFFVFNKMGTKPHVMSHLTVETLSDVALYFLITCTKSVPVGPSQGRMSTYPSITVDGRSDMYTLALGNLYTTQECALHQWIPWSNTSPYTCVCCSNVLYLD